MKALTGTVVSRPLRGDFVIVETSASVHPNVAIPNVGRGRPGVRIMREKFINGCMPQTTGTLISFELNDERRIARAATGTLP